MTFFAGLISGVGPGRRIARNRGAVDTGAMDSLEVVCLLWALSRRPIAQVLADLETWPVCYRLRAKA